MPIKNWYYLRKDTAGLQKQVIDNPNDTYLMVIDENSPNSGNIISVSNFIDTTKPYLSYKCVSSQSGVGSNVVSTFGDETFFIGVTYTIVANPDNEDLTTIGAPNNNVGTKFICNQSAIAQFTTSVECSSDTSLPVVISEFVNEIGSVWWEWDGDGEYLLFSDGLFIEGKTYLSLTLDAPNSLCYSITYISENSLKLNIFNSTDGLRTEINGQFYLEISVFN